MWEAKSCTHLVHSGVGISDKVMGTPFTLYLAPGGGGGISRREHARRTCSSPSLMSMTTGCTALKKAVTYLRASAFCSNGSGKSVYSKFSSEFASLMYAHLQIKSRGLKLVFMSRKPFPGKPSKRSPDKVNYFAPILQSLEWKPLCS